MRMQAHAVKVMLRARAGDGSLYGELEVLEDGPTLSRQLLSATVLLICSLFITALTVDLMMSAMFDHYRTDSGSNDDIDV